VTVPCSRAPRAARTTLPSGIFADSGQYRIGLKIVDLLLDADYCQFVGRGSIASVPVLQRHSTDGDTKAINYNT